MEQDRYTTGTLPNGLKFAISHTPDSAVNYCGIDVNAGSRDEAPQLHGIAHFVEHTIFKGTSRLSSLAIDRKLESVGGELNAYTTKEDTMIYSATPKGYADRAISLIAEIASDSIFPPEELEKEKDVVIEEIKSYRDSPEEMVFDEFEKRIYAGSSMAHPILGSEESVRSIDSADCRRWLERGYAPANMAFYYAGPEKAVHVIRLMEKSFGHLKSAGIDFPAREIPPMNPQFSVIEDHSYHQAHTVVGSRVCSLYDDRRFGIMFLNNYLAGPAMISRLNQELREKRGWVYTVDGYQALNQNSGVWMVYFGSDLRHVKPSLRLIGKELLKLAENPIKPVTFDRIKRQVAGQLLVSSDNRESTATQIGRTMLRYGEVRDFSWTADRLLSLSATQIQDAAQMILSAGLSHVTLH